MRKSVLAGLFACVVMISAQPSTASAATTDIIQTNTRSRRPVSPLLAVATVAIERPEITLIEASISNKDDAQKDEEAPKKHEVVKGESLSEIAKKYETTWRRIFDKNEGIDNPDILNPGDELVIPLEEEQLEARNLPTPVAPVVQAASTTRKAAPAAQQAAYVPPAGSSAGNRYVAGYCTWYVKGRRPDLPNNLGNAATWVSRAAAQGLPTGSAPRVGAVGQRGNHVVYVEAVNADGTVTVSEMNRRALYQKTSRTEPASYFSYIY